MKIGFSFGKCIRDIVNGNVDIDDVVMLMTRTSCVREDLDLMVDQYSYERSYLLGLDIDECKRVAGVLWDSGRVHQPRLFNQRYYGSVSSNYVWMDLSPTLGSSNPSVEAAWKNYQVLLKLSEGRSPDIDKAKEAIKSLG
jgi:hypothetical protein